MIHAQLRSPPSVSTHDQIAVIITIPGEKVLHKVYEYNNKEREEEEVEGRRGAVPVLSLIKPKYSTTVLLGPSPPPREIISHSREEERVSLRAVDGLHYLYEIPQETTTTEAN